MKFDFYRLAACSRCYRAELPGGKSEGNLYRVHEFTKVEMFAVTTDDDQVAQEMHNEIVRLQTLMFEELGLHFRFNQIYFNSIFLSISICRLLDMPTEELGLSAHRKYDIEAWMPAKEFYGEVCLIISHYFFFTDLIYIYIDK